MSGELVNLKCGNPRYNPLIETSEDQFDIRDGINNKVRISEEQNVKVYRIDNVDYAAPTISTRHNPTVAEVGETIAAGNVRFTVEEGSEQVSSIVSVPDHSPFSVGQEKDVAFTNLTRNTPGLGNEIAVTITDGLSIQTAVDVGIPFKHRFFQGIQTLADLNEAQIEALTDISGANGRLSDGIMNLYGGSKNYILPSDGFVRFIHWLYPVGTPGINGALYNGLPLPLTTLGNKTITNSHGLSVELIHKRTSAAFGGGTYAFVLS